MAFEECGANHSASRCRTAWFEPFIFTRRKNLSLVVIVRIALRRSNQPGTDQDSLRKSTGFQNERLCGERDVRDVPVYGNPLPSPLQMMLGPDNGD
jgi:hypothetical protein